MLAFLLQRRVELFLYGLLSGAAALLSPLTGDPDFGSDRLEPRFQWTGVGDALAATGFKVVPRLLPLPELPRSDRRTPSWVISTGVLIKPALPAGRPLPQRLGGINPGR